MKEITAKKDDNYKEKKQKGETKEKKKRGRRSDMHTGPKKEKNWAMYGRR